MLHFFEHCCRLGEVVLLGRYSEQKPNFTSNCSLPRSSHTLQLYRVSTHSSDCIFTKHRTCILQIQKYLRLFCFVVNRCGESLWRKTPSHMHSLKAWSLFWKALLLFPKLCQQQGTLTCLLAKTTTGRVELFWISWWSSCFAIGSRAWSAESTT